MTYTNYELVYFKFLRVSHQVEDRIKNALKECELTHPQLNILHILSDAHPKAMNVKDLKGKMVVSQPDITRLIDRLVNKGLVKRETCADNRRKVDVLLTKEGQSAFGLAHDVGKKSVGDFFENFLTETEAKDLHKLLNKIKL